MTISITFRKPRIFTGIGIILAFPIKLTLCMLAFTYNEIATILLVLLDLLFELVNFNEAVINYTISIDTINYILGRLDLLIVGRGSRMDRIIDIRLYRLTRRH